MNATLVLSETWRIDLVLRARSLIGESKPDASFTVVRPGESRGVLESLAKRARIGTGRNILLNASVWPVVGIPRKGRHRDGHLHARRIHEVRLTADDTRMLGGWSSRDCHRGLANQERS